MPKKQPHILTSDNVSISVGMKLYCYDTCSVPVKLQTLTVIDIDLGRSRSLRLRRTNKREWTWSAVDRQGTCQNQNHVLYADRKRAAVIVKKMNNDWQLKHAAQAVKDAEKTLAKSVANNQWHEREAQKGLAKIGLAKRKLASAKKKLLAIS